MAAGLIWSISITLALPNLIGYHVIQINDSGDFGCVLNNAIIPDNRWRHYVFAMVMLQYVLSLLAITFTYGHMAKTLWGMETPEQADNQRDLAIQANKKKVTKMLFMVVILFGICWFPLQVFNFLSSLEFPLSFTGINYVWMASHVLAMSNSCVNPFIYGIYNVR